MLTKESATLYLIMLFAATILPSIEFWIEANFEPLAATLDPQINRVLRDDFFITFLVPVYSLPKQQTQLVNFKWFSTRKSY